jgi:transcriptional regulator with XRE-family HTH domain
MNMEATTNPKKSKRKFKQTKQLVRLALNDSWSQIEIADACRTQQSVVSAWSKGTKQATEQQLKPLLEAFGYKLRRNTFRVYWNIDSETKERTFHKVEGKVILSQAFYDARRSGYTKTTKIPQQKLVIHHQGENQFRLVIQSRLKFAYTSEELESTVEDAIWASEISKQLELPDILNFIDDYAKNSLTNYPSDANTLPFIARQALLNHGFNIDGVVEYPAVW